MTLIPFDNTTSRYSDNKNWTKILFNKDRKLQTTEAIEIQDLIENQLKKVSKNLYNFYNIVKGCQVLLTNVISDTDSNEKTYNYLMTAGQAFIELKDISSYIDIPSFNFSIKNNNVYYVGVNFKVEVLKNSDETKGPFTGGIAFGELGADRLIITPTVNLYTDVNEKSGFYPIAIIKPTSQTFLDNNPEEVKGLPVIFYYRNNQVNTQYKDNYLPIFIEDKLEEILSEISGDFIAEGLGVSYKTTFGPLENVNQRLLNIKIDTGVAYIQGKRFEYNYVTTKNFSMEEDLTGSIIHIYINEKGIIKSDLVTPELKEIYNLPNNSLSLATVLCKFDNKFEVINSNNLMPEVSDIIKYKKQHIKNKRDLLDLSLGIDEIYLTRRSSTLTGIFSDSFSSLKNTNTSHPLYNASIVPSIQAISLPFIETTKGIDAMNIENEQNLQVHRDNTEIIWSSVDSGDLIINENIARTSSIKLGVNNINSANLEVTPNVLYTKNSNLNVSYLPDNITSSLSSTYIEPTLKVESSQETKTLYITSTGFGSNEDNITLKIDSVNINTAILLKGTQPGTTAGTYKANEAGHIYLKVEYSFTTTNEILYIFLEGKSTIASNQIRIIDLIQSRSDQDNLNITTPIAKSSSVLTGVAATFTVLKTTSLKGVQIVLTEFNNTVALNRSILDVYLTRTNFGIPTDEVIAKGSLELVDSIPVLNSFVLVEFDRLAELTTGEYALVFSTTYENLSLGTSKAGENVAGLGVAGSYNTSTNKLYRCNVNIWEELEEALTLKLVQRIPNAITTSTNISLENIEPFNALEINLPVQFTPSSAVNFSINNTILNRNTYFFSNEVKNTTVSINTFGTTQSHPILELDNININLFSYKTNGTWISINKEFIRPYNLIEVSFDMYSPDNASFNVYFSSNQGQTWEELSVKNLEDEYIYLEELTEVNRALPLYNYKFRKEGLSFVDFNGETIQRTQLMIRIDLSVESLENLPFFKNLIALTY